jgi:hypothetical protein
VLHCAVPSPILSLLPTAGVRHRRAVPQSISSLISSPVPVFFSLLGLSGSNGDSGEPADNWCSHAGGSSSRCIPPSLLFPHFNLASFDVIPNPSASDSLTRSLFCRVDFFANPCWKASDFSYSLWFSSFP